MVDYAALYCCVCGLLKLRRDRGKPCRAAECRSTSFTNVLPPFAMQITVNDRRFLRSIRVARDWEAGHVEAAKESSE